MKDTVIEKKGTRLFPHPEDAMRGVNLRRMRMRDKLKKSLIAMCTRNQKNQVIDPMVREEA
jgi:hypothetical protein